MAATFVSSERKPATISQSRARATTLPVPRRLPPAARPTIPRAAELALLMNRGARRDQREGQCTECRVPCRRSVASACSHPAFVAPCLRSWAPRRPTNPIQESDLALSIPADSSDSSILRLRKALFSDARPVAWTLGKSFGLQPARRAGCRVPCRRPFASARDWVMAGLAALDLPYTLPYVPRELVRMADPTDSATACSHARL